MSHLMASIAQEAENEPPGMYETDLSNLRDC